MGCYVKWLSGYVFFIGFFKISLLPISIISCWFVCICLLSLGYMLFLSDSVFVFVKWLRGMSFFCLLIIFIISLWISSAKPINLVV